MKQAIYQILIKEKIIKWIISYYLQLKVSLRKTDTLH